MIELYRRVSAPLWRYVAHDDPLVAAGNLVAVVVAYNTPFYPLYVGWVAGWDGMPWALLTWVSMPFFALVPAVARWSSVAGRAMLPLVGTVNTLFCTWLFGVGAGEQLFLLPCITIAALLFRPSERVVMLVVSVVPMVLYWWLRDRFPAAPWVYSADELSGLLSMNVASVAFLSVFVGIAVSRAYVGEAAQRG